MLTVGSDVTETMPVTVLGGTETVTVTADYMALTANNVVLSLTNIPSLGDTETTSLDVTYAPVSVTEMVAGEDVNVVDNPPAGVSFGDSEAVMDVISSADISIAIMTAAGGTTVLGTDDVLNESVTVCLAAGTALQEQAGDIGILGLRVD